MAASFCTDNNNLTLDVIREYQDNFSHNRVLYVVHSIILSVTHFCKTTFYNLNSLKYHGNNLLIRDYIKRYKAFVDYTTYFNEQMENLNIIINYLYDYFFKNKPIQVKFSFIRVFVSIFKI